MPDRADVDALSTMIEQGRYVEAIERFYTEHASMQENLGAKRTGRETLVSHEKGVMGAFAEIRAERLGPTLIAGDIAASRWRFTFAPKNGGKTMVLEEVAWQRWEGNKVAEERFYYDPGQMQA